MRFYHKTALIGGMALLAFLILAWAAIGQGEGYGLGRRATAGGGGSSSGGPFILTDTIGQPIASDESSGGGNYSLSDGFWQVQVTTGGHKVYLPLLIKSAP